VKTFIPEQNELQKTENYISIPKQDKKKTTFSSKGKQCPKEENTLLISTNTKHKNTVGGGKHSMLPSSSTKRNFFCLLSFKKITAIQPKRRQAVKTFSVRAFLVTSLK
jgi:hypothetical protein